VFDKIDYATREARDEADGSVLRLKLPPTFAMRWLVPRLTRFKSLHPKIDIQVVRRMSARISGVRYQRLRSLPSVSTRRRRAAARVFAGWGFSQAFCARGSISKQWVWLAGRLHHALLERRLFEEGGKQHSFDDVELAAW